MKVFPTILLLFFVAQTNLSAQKFDKTFLDDTIRMSDTAFASSKALYIINGVPANPLKIDSIINSYDLKYLASIDILKESSKVVFYCNRISDVVIITFAYKQKTKKKRELLHKVQQLFRYESSSSKYPTLYVDNQLVKDADVKQKIRSLTLETIYCILISGSQNEKNQVIKIWTVDVKEAPAPKDCSADEIMSCS